jgi:diguanylate cyclase (GGDEF)-like protein
MKICRSLLPLGVFPFPVSRFPLEKFWISTKNGERKTRNVRKKLMPKFGIVPNRMKGRSVVGFMADQNPDNKKRLDLSAALRIIQNAGMNDDRLASDDADVQIQAIIDSLCRLSTHDGLTGLVNATFFHAVLGREIDRSTRTGRTCGLMVIDIDHFKQVNDTYGHAAGDKALQAVADELALSLRSMDTAARIGGEEFAVILPECSPDDAISAATRIHSILNPLAVTVEQTTIELATSAGLVWTNPNKPVGSAVLLTEADQEMYRAKWSGRGRLCYSRPESTLVSSHERSALMNLRLEEGIHGH